MRFGSPETHRRWRSGRRPGHLPELTAEELRAREEARERHQASKARVAAVCACPRRIWAAPGTFTAGDILCAVCGSPFKRS
jgi:hypothetical protein